MKVVILAVLSLALLALSSLGGCGTQSSRPQATPTPTLPATPTPKPCRADFSAEPTEGEGTTLVSFTDLSIGQITKWEWDLDGDGVIDSTAQNPKHYYREDGDFTVTLTISGPDCEDTLTKQDYISIAGCKT